jgi:hypothetical protein
MRISRRGCASVVNSELLVVGAERFRIDERVVRGIVEIEAHDQPSQLSYFAPLS